MKSPNVLSNLKSDYFLIKLFDNLLKKKSLDIIKYNNKLKNRINIDINNYKKYLEIYSSIELEIKPNNKTYGEFININKDNEMYYHIYFNNNVEEIKRNYLNENEKIKTIKIIIDYQVISFEKLFCDCVNIKYINFKKFYRKNIINMNDMFNECDSLKEINLSNFNTKNVTDMKNMFFGCSLLKELDLSNFNTSNAKDMSEMFYGCSSLKKIYIFKMIANIVIDMNHMFYGCTSLEEISPFNFNISNENSMKGMFYRCSKKFQKKIKEKDKNIKEEAFDINDLIQNKNKYMEYKI